MAASKRLTNLRRRVALARKFPTNTCAASRHLHIMADRLMKKGGYPMLAEEPEHCGVSIGVTVELLWKARAEIARLRTQLQRPAAVPAREEPNSE